jgi:hypothetical protein
MKHKSYPLELPELFRNNPDLREFIQALKYEILESLRPPDQQVIDDVDLRKMLKISKRTAANYRAQGLLDHYRLGGKILYKLSDVFSAMEKNKIPGISSKVRLGKNL